jgi:dCMP deaminase
MELSRPTWPEIWIGIAKLVAQRSYDETLKVGAVVVSEDNSQMLSMGYNGNYKGGPHERESEQPGFSGFIHAEVNALVKCDFNFHKKKHMYLTHSPCRNCAKLIVNAEIDKVFYDIQYRDTSGLEILTSAGIKVFNLRDVIIKNKIP